MGKCTAVVIKDGGGQAEGVPVRDFVLVRYGQTVRDILQRLLSNKVQRQPSTAHDGTEVVHGHNRGEQLDHTYLAGTWEPLHHER